MSRMEPSAHEPVRDAAEPFTVLIVGDDAAFARNIVGRWQGERTIPAVTVVSSEILNGVSQGKFSLAIVGEIRGQGVESVLRSLEAAGAPVIFVAENAEAGQRVRDHFPRVLVLRQYDGWLEALITLATEALRKSDVLSRLQASEQNLSANRRDATLGRYMLEMRPGMNNCLTSIIGNAELLLFEPGLLSGESREQVQTIHNMAMRLHEVLHRFSSLETEMQFSERQSQSETRQQSQAVGSRR